MPDVFGRMVADYHRDELTGQPVYERSDGDESPAQCAWYFAGPSAWGPLERAALAAVPGGDGSAAGATEAGPVLDAGCGPGRALEPLADRGHRVVGLDESAGAVRVAGERTGEPVVVGDLATLPLAAGTIRSALVLGTHVGTGGSVDAFRSLLDEFDRALGTGGRVVADLYDPTAVEDEALATYLADRWLEEGVATRRFRLRYDGAVGGWRTLLMCSPAALEWLVAPTAWRVASLRRGEPTRYLFALERGSASEAVSETAASETASPAGR